MMTKKDQVQNIRIFLKKHYNISNDIIDIEAEIDSSLTIGENLTSIINKYVKITIREVQV